MASLNKTQIIGNVGRDPEMRYTPSGQAVCSFSVAVTERWTDRQTNEKREKTEWYRVTAWGATGEACNTYLKKGSSVFVEGTVKASAYLNNNNEPAASLELTAKDIQFLSGGSGGNGGGGNQQPSQEHSDDSAPPPPKDMGDIPF